jgi:hypothetical protein
MGLPDLVDPRIDDQCGGPALVTKSWTLLGIPEWVSVCCYHRTTDPDAGFGRQFADVVIAP